MAGAQTIVRVVSQKFFSQLKNGDDFSENTSDYTTHLKAGIGETVRAQIEIQVGAFAELSNYVWQVYDGDTRARIDMSGGGFRNAFSAGDSVRYNEGDAASTLARGALMTVLSVEDDHIEFDIVSPLLGGLGANNNSSFPTYESGWITNISDLNGLEYKFGIIENDESTNYISKLTNIEELYRVSNVPLIAGTGQKSGVYSGENKAAQTGYMNVDFIKKVDDNNLLYQPTPFMSWNEYRIKHTFDVLPTYRDGDTESIEKTDIPPDDIYNGSLSLKYVFQSSFMRTITDVNSRLIGGWDTTDGSVGYFGESFNGYPTTYSLDSVAYFDVTDSIDTDRLNVTNTVRVNCLIDDSSNSFENGNPVVVWHSAILDSDAYTLSKKNYKTLWTKESIRNEIGEPATSNGFIKDFSITRINSGQIEVEFDVDFTATQQGVLEDGQPYILAVVCEQDGETTDTGGKTTILIDFNEYNKNSDIDGLFTLVRNEHFDHPRPWVNSATSTGATNAKVDVEEGIMTFTEFSLNLAEDAVLTGLSFNVTTYNTVTNEFGVLEKIDISLGDQVLTGGVQQISLDETRGFKLKEGNQFNLLQLRTTIGVTDVSQNYETNVGWRIPWQSWLEYFNAPPEFFDATQPLNNLNRFAATYSKDSNPTLPNLDPNDYVLRTGLFAEVEKDGVTTTYRGWTEEIGVWGYDEDDQPPVPPTYTCTIETFDSEGNNLENNVLKSGCEIRATLIPDVTPNFTKEIDFNKASDYNDPEGWNRFAHGTLYTNAILPDTNRLATWANDQAKDASSGLPDDVFIHTSLPGTFQKEDDLYDSTVDTISAKENLGAFYGIFSLESYEFYQITGKMFSTDSDNDCIIYTIAFMTDEFGVEHTLSLVATTGGVLLDPNPVYNGTDSDVDIFEFNQPSPDNQCAWALVYDYGKIGFTTLKRSADTNIVGLGWNSGIVGDLSFNIERNGNSMSIGVDWPITGTTNQTEIFNYNLTDNSFTEKFIGFNQIGFGFHSQAGGGFKDIVLVVPDADFWAELKMNPKESSSDSEQITLSTENVQTEDNGLIHPSDESPVGLATINWVTDRFTVRGRVNPDTFNPGLELDLSVEIGSKNNIS